MSLIISHGGICLSIVCELGILRKFVVCVLCIAIKVQMYIDTVYHDKVQLIVFQISKLNFVLVNYLENPRIMFKKKYDLLSISSRKLCDIQCQLNDK